MDSVRRKWRTWRQRTRKRSPQIQQADQCDPPKTKGQIPLELIAKILLKLYEVFSDQDPQCGRALRRTLAACRLVCLPWSKIVKAHRGGFVIQADNKEWLCPTYPSYIPRHTPRLLQDEDEINQESDCGWLPENYTAALADSHPKFLPELIPNMVLGIYGYPCKFGVPVNAVKLVIQSTLAACCLVNREWNRTFTPLLYQQIVLEGSIQNPLLVQSLLLRTFRHTQPAHKSLVKIMEIGSGRNGSTANLLSI